MNTIDRFTTMDCPHCRTSIHVWFVREEGHCPACWKKITNGNSAVIEQPRRLVPVFDDDISEDDILVDTDPSLP